MKVFSNDLLFEVTWKPFFLNPTTPESGVPLIQYLTQKYGPRAGAMAKDGTSPLTKAGMNVVINHVTVLATVLLGRQAHQNNFVLEYNGKYFARTFISEIENIMNLVLDSRTNTVSYFRHVCQPQTICIFCNSY